MKRLYHSRLVTLQVTYEKYNDVLDEKMRCSHSLPKEIFVKHNHRER